MNPLVDILDEDSKELFIQDVKQARAAEPPKNIYVYFKSDKETYPMKFHFYLLCVMREEMGYDYSGIKGFISGITEAQYKEGMKACAMAIKMYSWFRRTVMAKHKDWGDHVCTSPSCCQGYIAGDYPVRIQEAFNTLCRVGVRTNVNGILYSHYQAGSFSRAGTKSSGRLEQYGAFYLAKKL